ncbi:MAG: hypothetical protein ACOYON_01235 [Fimbriimonas sp.]
MGKVSPATFYIVGISLSIIVLTFFGFYHLMPNLQEKSYWDEQKRLLQDEADKQPQADRRVKTAQQLVDEKDKAWQQIVAARTPSANLATGGIDLSVNGFQLTVDARKFRNSIQKAVNNQVRQGGITVINGPSVPFPDDNASGILANYFNYPALRYPIVIFDFGTITVQGTYDQINNHVKSWAKMPRYLAVADGLRFEGTSPRLTGTYNLSVVGFLRGKEIFPAVPEGGGGGAAAAGPRSGPGAFPRGPR